MTFNLNKPYDIREKYNSFNNWCSKGFGTSMNSNTQTAEYFPAHNYENYAVGANQSHMGYMNKTKTKDFIVNLKPSIHYL